MTMAELRKYRGMPFAKRGMRVKSTHSGQHGRIAGANQSGNLNIIFDGDTWSQNCHPHWKMIYFNKAGDVIARFND